MARGKGRNGRRRNRRRLRGNRGFSNIVSSPWRRITFTLEVDASFNTWGRVKNTEILKGLNVHLGFKPESELYLEARYISIQARRQRAGTALSLRLYRVEPDKAAVDTSYAVIREVESYATNAFAYPTCRLSWDRVSRCTPLLQTEVQPVFALYPHIVAGEPNNNAVTVCSITLLYRHAATPFETDSPSTRIARVTATPLSLTTMTPSTSPFDNLNIDSPH